MDEDEQLLIAIIRSIRDEKKHREEIDEEEKQQQQQLIVKDRKRQQLIEEDRKRQQLIEEDRKRQQLIEEEGKQQQIIDDEKIALSIANEQYNTDNDYLFAIKASIKSQDEYQQILNDENLALAIHKSLKNRDFTDDEKLSLAIQKSLKEYSKYPKHFKPTWRDEIIRNENIEKKFNDLELMKNIKLCEKKFNDTNTCILREGIKKLKLCKNTLHTDRPISILKSQGDGSCLLHSLNQLLFINGYDHIVILDPKLWRTIITQFIDNYIQNNLSRLNLTDDENVLLITLNEEKKDLLNPTGWLSYTTIMIFCTIFNVNIRVIDNSTNTRNYMEVEGLGNINPTTFNGGLFFNGSHWDCFIIN